MAAGPGGGRNGELVSKEQRKKVVKMESSDHHRTVGEGGRGEGDLTLVGSGCGLVTERMLSIHRA